MQSAIEGDGPLACRSCIHRWAQFAVRLSHASAPCREERGWAETLVLTEPADIATRTSAIASSQGRTRHGQMFVHTSASALSSSLACRQPNIARGVVVTLCSIEYSAAFSKVHPQ